MDYDYLIADVPKILACRVEKQDNFIKRAIFVGRYVRQIKVRDSWQWLLRRNFRWNFVPRKVAIAFRSGDKNRGVEPGRSEQKKPTETGENKDQRRWAKENERKYMRKWEREREREREGELGREWEREESRAPVTVHEKTNSVILFGRRAKPSVWRHTIFFLLFPRLVLLFLVLPLSSHADQGN